MILIASSTVGRQRMVLHEELMYPLKPGWMNPILSGIDFWRRSEQFITATTGAIPRADDQKWTK